VLGVNIYAIIIAGAFGAIANILYLKNGRFSYPRVFTDLEGNRHFIAGFLGEIFLGIIAGFVAVVPISSGSSLGLLQQIYIAILGGFSGGIIIEKRSRTLETTKNNYLNELEGSIEAPSQENSVDIQKTGGDS
jgi:uncharacterized membrane protein YeaQ/YmgE (transglycosylase-associated protein family)